MQRNGHGRSVELLIVEDDDDLRDTLCRYFRRAGLSVTGAADCASVPADATRFDVAVCDINLPDQSGFSLAAQLRDKCNIGLIMLTARGQIEDRVMGLSLGADDYLVKPVDLRELELRIRSLARRVRGGRNPAAGGKPTDREGAWHLWHDTWHLQAPGRQETAHLTAAEFRLLGKLVERVGEAVTRDELLAAMGRAQLNDYSRNLDVTISRLRRKVQQTCGRDLPVTAVRGVGYAFTATVRQI